MAIFKKIMKRTSLKGFRGLLPSSVLSSLPSEVVNGLYDWEEGLQDGMFRFEGARMGFYLLCALDEDKFKGLVLEALKTDSDRSYKRYSKTWKAFLRLLFVHAVTPPECEPVPLEVCNKFTGDKTNMNRFMMWEDGWILKTGWRNHFRLSPKGTKIVEACIKQCEREYSEFYISMIEYKRAKMGDLADE